MLKAGEVFGVATDGGPQGLHAALLGAMDAGNS